MLCALCLLAASTAIWGQTPKLMGLDEALEAAATAMEAKIAAKTEIAVYKIEAGNDEVGEYLADDLNDRFVTHKKLTSLARENARRYVDSEHQFQMSGMVSDESAVGVGHYLGAKVVITGTFNRYADFSQLRLRAVDVRTSAQVETYTARIRNNDKVLANITAPIAASPMPKISEKALEAVNKGKDLLAEGKKDAAIQELNRAISIDPALQDATAYFNRGLVYFEKQDYDKAIADFNNAIQLDPNYARAYYNRGVVYDYKQDYDKAIADFTQAIRFNPNYAIAYGYRGLVYFEKQDYDKAIADSNQAIQLDPNNASVYYTRGYAYYMKKDYDNAIADCEAALRINPNHANAKAMLESARKARGR